MTTETGFKLPAADRWFEHYRAGDRYRFGPVEVTEQEIVEFACRYDPQSFHIDPQAAAAGPYGSVIPSGWMTAALVMRLLELGQITAEEAADHPQRNVLYRALGQGEPFEADISTQPIPEGGWILLCSDGLWGLVPEKEMADIVRSSPTLKTASQRLVDAANEAGGPDNITAILIRLPD